MQTNDQLDEVVRVAVYEHVVRTGRVPQLTALAVQLGATTTELATSYRRLAARRALVLDADGAIAMAIPFAATPTAVRVVEPNVTWWANCAFDGLGIPAMLGCDGAVETACPQSGAPIVVSVHDGTPSGVACVLHMAVPLARWWDNLALALPPEAFDAQHEVLVAAGYTPRGGKHPVLASRTMLR